ncbi:hypothetical protein [Phormidium sp. CCY1219]|uniref:hypothetical protein n=1 Tax=Phormidium sp. CCY1219 TaxID=2886104 RepID=UPI002D798500|nr:hypothetical protein [Phormidium sp. CCY1219]
MGDFSVDEGSLAPLGTVDRPFSVAIESGMSRCTPVENKSAGDRPQATQYPRRNL